jgi:hypothetical protein
MVLRTMKNYALSVVVVALALVACSASEPKPEAVDAGLPTTDAQTQPEKDATSKDATTETMCEGACRTLNVSLTLGGKTIRFERAQFGGDASKPYVELHIGGNAACPDANSPTPTYTMIVNLSVDGSLGAITFFDFGGDVLQGAPLLKGTLTQASVSHTSAKTWVAADFAATFQNANGAGTASGHIFANYCTSLD